MTVSNATFRSPWVAANGSNKVWNYSFFLAQQSHVVMQVRNNTTGVITEYTNDLTLIKTTDVTGTVTFPVSAAAIASGNSVRVVRRVPYTQEVAIGNEGAFDPELHETAFDTLETQMQQVADGTSRALQVPDGNIGGVVQAGVAVDRVMASDGANGLKDTGWTTTTIAGNVSAAAASASAAAASQTAAAASATAALGSQNAAATSAGNAATSEANALSYRNTTQGYMNTTLGYRDTTQGYMNSASTYATNASTSATNAATSNTNAQNALTAALAAQAAAESARDSTLAAYDSFDDRYLGPKAADPALDNDGNALVGGSLYFNTTTGAMMVYVTGTGWTAAYISPTGVPLLANAGSDYNAAAFRANVSLYSKAEIDAYGFSRAAKTTPVDADTLFGSDSAAGNAQVKFTWANIKVAMKTFMQTGLAMTGPITSTTIISADGSITQGPASSATGRITLGNTAIEIGTQRTADGLAYIDWTTQVGADFNFRLLRNTGVNGTVDIIQGGTGNVNITTGGGIVAINGNQVVDNSWGPLRQTVDNSGITGGFSHTADADGTFASGTYTPTYAGGNYKTITNNGAFTLAAPTAGGSYNLEIDITNGATAGAITWSGFITGYPKGDPLTTVNGNKFKLHISKTAAGVTAVVEALQ